MYLLDVLASEQGRGALPLLLNNMRTADLDGGTPLHKF
jgi:hypothetical protein